MAYFLMTVMFCKDYELAYSIMGVETNYKNVISKEGSIGLMQVRVSTAQWIGCEAKDVTGLMNERLNVMCACSYLDILAKKYTKKRDIAAAYNAGSARRCKTGVLSPSGKKCKIGEYINQSYVDKVMRRYNEF